MTFPTPCRVCGCRDVVVDAVQNGATALALGECPRCDDRWIQPIDRLARRTLAARPLSPRAHHEAVSNAA